METGPWPQLLASHIPISRFVKRKEGEEKEDPDHSRKSQDLEEKENGAEVPRTGDWKGSSPAHPVFQPSDFYGGLEVKLSVLIGLLEATVFHLPQFLHS